jgi:nucleotide-binding universal stress UspA family protein
MPAPELRTVLAATDLGEGGEEVLRAAGALAAAAGASLHVLHAFDFSPDPYPGLELGPAAGFQGRIREAELALDEQVRRAVPAGVEVAGRRVEIDTAARAILAYAEGMGVDMVVLGPHRGRGIADAFLGSTADRVVRSARVPCLVARGEQRFPLRRVVVPLDFSAPSRVALEAAFGLCRAFGADAVVHAVHVIPRLFEKVDVPLRDDHIKPALHGVVEAALGPPEQRAAIKVREEVVWGDSVPDEILSVARSLDADLLVLGTRGHGGLERALLGSVAGSVARRAGCPVLLVPPGEPA